MWALGVDCITDGEISMSKAIENLQAAQHKAMAIRPKVGGFPYLAEVLRYDVDFAARTVAYYGCNGEEYIESYPAVDAK